MTRAGNTTRLYTNGIFHSQFNTVRPLGGAIWDLLALPALLARQQQGLKVLVLGVGGGAVIRQLHYLLDAPKITGIDIDAVHLSVARRWFGIQTTNTTLIHADALDWVRHRSVSQGRFDIIIDDLFGGGAGDPVRVVDLDSAWSKSLSTLLAPQGVVIVNSLSPGALKRAPLGTMKHLCGGLLFSHASYTNTIGLYAGEGASRRRLLQCIAEHPRLTAHDRRTAAALLSSLRVTRFAG